jgi:hypothetical protein
MDRFFDRCESVPFLRPFQSPLCSLPPEPLSLPSPSPGGRHINPSWLIVMTMWNTLLCPQRSVLVSTSSRLETPSLSMAILTHYQGMHVYSLPKLIFSGIFLLMETLSAGKRLTENRNPVLKSLQLFDLITHHLFLHGH